MKLPLLLLSLLTFSSAMAEDTSNVTVKKSGIWYSTQGLSPSGRYACGSSMYNGAFRWDTETGDLMWVSAKTSTSEMGFYDVSDNGILVGETDDQHPGYYENGEWHDLSIYGGAASRITGDASIICGDEYYPAAINKPFDVRPTVWYRQADGTYKKQELPNPQTDWLGGKTQFNTARVISNDGRFVVGVQVEDRGRYYTCILWEKQADGTWTYSLPFADKEFNIERFKQIEAEMPQTEDYIFVQPGQAGYFDQVRNFQRVYAEWQYKLNSEGRTGLYFAMPPVVMSDTGYTLSAPLQRTTWSYVPGEMEIGKESTVTPVTYNLATKELTEYTNAVGSVAYTVSEDGTMLTSDGYDTYVIPSDNSGVVMLDEWLEKNYGFDLWSALPTNTAYVEDQAISSDGKKIFIMYTSVTLEGELDDMQLTVIKLPGATDGINDITVTTSRAPKGTFDLQGRKISDIDTSHGFFIIDGKKVKK